MENKLEIQKIQRPDALELLITGRIDAYWSEYLNTTIDEEIRAGHHHLNFNLTGVSFISSIGIRLFIRYRKELGKINGNLLITEASEDVKKVFTLAGLEELFQPLAEKITEDRRAQTTQYESSLASYTVNDLKKNQGITLILAGHPEKFDNSSFTAEDFTYVECKPFQYSLGLGALGAEFDDYGPRTGEYLCLSNVAAYLPSDGSQKPDYMIKTGKLIPGIHVLYGLTLEGNMNLQIRFDLTTEKYLTLNQMIEDVMKLSGYDDLAIVILAETSGLVGASLLQSPFTRTEGSSAFIFPAVRDSINFTTEPVHNKMLTLVAGIAMKSKDKRLAEFTRPVSDNSPVCGHFHAAVFPYVAMKKDRVSLEETLEELFEYSPLTNILHLINDQREGNGAGDSEFIQGSCWIGKIETIK